MENFKSLWVWKEGIDLATEIYELTKKGEFSKDYGLKNNSIKGLFIPTSGFNKNYRKNLNFS